MLLELGRLAAKQGLWEICRDAAKALQELLAAGSVREKPSEAGSVALDLEFLLCEIDASAIAERSSDLYTKRCVDVRLLPFLPSFLPSTHNHLGIHIHIHLGTQIFDIHLGTQIFGIWLDHLPEYFSHFWINSSKL